jgi:hypothetical protein
VQRSKHHLCLARLQGAEVVRGKHEDWVPDYMPAAEAPLDGG